MEAKDESAAEPTWNVTNEFHTVYSILMEKSGNSGYIKNILKCWISDMNEQNLQLLQAVDILERAGLHQVDMITGLLRKQQSMGDEQKAEKDLHKLLQDIEYYKKINSEQEETIHCLEEKQRQLALATCSNDTLHSCLKENIELESLKKELEDAQKQNDDLVQENECLRDMYESLCKEMQNATLSIEKDCPEAGAKTIYDEYKSLDSFQEGSGLAEYDENLEPQNPNYQVKPNPQVSQSFSLVDDDHLEQMERSNTILREIEDLKDQLECCRREIYANERGENIRRGQNNDELEQFTKAQQVKINLYSDKINVVNCKIGKLSERLSKVQYLKHRLEEAICAYRDSVMWMQQKLATANLHESTVDFLSSCSLDVERETLNQKQLRNLLDEKEIVIQDLTNYIYNIPDLERQLQDQRELMDQTLINENHLYYLYETANEQLKKTLKDAGLCLVG